MINSRIVYDDQMVNIIIIDWGRKAWEHGYSLPWQLVSASLCLPADQAVYMQSSEFKLVKNSIPLSQTS